MEMHANLPACGKLPAAFIPLVPENSRQILNIGCIACAWNGSSVNGWIKWGGGEPGRASAGKNQNRKLHQSGSKIHQDNSDVIRPAARIGCCNQLVA
jgi:hypothetical protein